jgi:glycerol uptake facilitator-like aquaporin
MNRSLAQRSLAELAGTALLAGLGIGSIVAGANAGGVPQWVLAAGWFFAVLLPVLLFARVSGAHLNPAVTLMLVCSRRFPPSEAPSYVLAQIAGAFLGAGVVLVTLGGAAHLGATLPRDDDLARTFLLELGFTVALLGSVIYLSHPEKVIRAWELFLPPIVVGISTYLIGPWTGSSLNPARTLAPAVLTGEYLGIWVYFLAALVACGASAGLVVALFGRSTALARTG